MTKQLLVKVWVVCAVAACGSVSNEKPDANGGDSIAAGDFALAVDMTSLSSAITGTANVTVTVTRDAALADPIALTATGLPAGVTATFAATSLPAGTDSTTVALAIDLAANPGTTDITITGTAGSLTHSATVSLELHTQTVTGKVRSGGTGSVVRIVGKSAVTTADAMGTFTFTDVKVPYDIYVQGQGGTDAAPIPAVTYYRGLTRLDPVVSKQFPACTGFCFLATFNNKSSALSGSRLGSGTNAGPTYVKFTSTDGIEINTDGAWAFNAGWFAAAANNNNTGRLQGLQAIRGALNAPTGWYFAESADVTLTSGSPSAINLTLAATTTAQLSGTVTQPAGFPNPTVTLTQQLAGYPFEVWTATTTSGGSTIPVLTNQKASFHATSTGGTGVTEMVVPGITAATDVTTMLPPPAGLTSPVAGASNVTTSTPFEFTTSANQVYQVTMSSSTAIFVIYTASGALTIPSLSEMPLPTATSFTWEVRGYGPLANIDTAADTAYLRGVSKFEAAGTMHSLTASPSRSFTSQ